MRERHVRAVGVCGLAAEPLGEEPGLRRALVGEIATEQRPELGVGFDANVQAVDQRADRGVTADAREHLAVGERAMRIRISEEATVVERRCHGETAGS